MSNEVRLIDTFHWHAYEATQNCVHVETKHFPHAIQFAPCRSTFLGTGAYGAHWTKDTSSSWDDLRWSIGASDCHLHFQPRPSLQHALEEEIQQLQAHCMLEHVHAQINMMACSKAEKT